MPTLTTSKNIDSTHLGKRLILRVDNQDTLATVLLPSGLTFTNGDSIRFFVDFLAAGSQIEFAAVDATPVFSDTRLYRQGQCGTIYFTGSAWHVESSTTLQVGPPIIKPAPLTVANITEGFNFGRASEHNAHYRSVASTPITIAVPIDSQWPSGGEYWMDGFDPTTGAMPIGGAAIFGCHSAAGGITFEAAVGVTINTASSLNLTKLHAKATLTKVAPDTWDLAGDLDAV